MRTCEKFKSQLSLYANEELAPQQTQRLAAHLEQCPNCRAEVDAYRQLAHGIHELPAPIIPEHALHGFAQGILQEIAPKQQRSHSLVTAFIATLFHPRWRYAWAAAGIIGFMLAVGLWYAPLERNSPRLAPLLQTRAWDKIYYGLLAKESRTLFLHEPVPVELLKTALAELVKQGERDQRVRVGVQRLLSAIAGRAASQHDNFSSAKIMGVVTARGYIPAPRTSGRSDNANLLLNELQTLPNNTAVTLAEIVNEKD